MVLGQIIVKLYLINNLIIPIILLELYKGLINY